MAGLGGRGQFRGHVSVGFWAFGLGERLGLGGLQDYVPKPDLCNGDAHEDQA